MEGGRSHEGPPHVSLPARRLWPDSQTDTLTSPIAWKPAKRSPLLQASQLLHANPGAPPPPPPKSSVQHLILPQALQQRADRIHESIQGQHGSQAKAWTQEEEHEDFFPPGNFIQLEKKKLRRSMFAKTRWVGTSETFSEQSSRGKATAVICALSCGQTSSQNAPLWVSLYLNSVPLEKLGWRLKCEVRETNHDLGDR